MEKISRLFIKTISLYIHDYIGITMMDVEAKVRKWGRSFGIVIPKEKIKQEGIKENETIRLLITKRKNVFKEIFGTVKLKRSTQEILDESDREAWDE